MIAMQMDFIELASAEEIKIAKSLLSRYRRHKDIITELEKMETLAPKQLAAYNAYLRATQAIERSVRLIRDQQIRKAIQLRYIDGIRRKDALMHFRYQDPSTFDRWVNKGIESVANSLKIFEG